MKISAEFIVSAAGPGDLPRDGLPQIAMVGRSNVGKSSLINALTRQRVARTSAAPGKTRLANVYRVQRGASAPFYLVDLPGYGYARGGAASAREFAELTDAYFRHDEETGSGRRVARRDERDRTVAPADQVRQKRVEEPTRQDRPGPGDSNVLDSPVRPVSALLLVDARHPGLESDRAAWQWLHRTARAAVVGTKIDKLARNQRMRALRQLESAFEDTVLPVSSVTGEGLDELWKLIDRLANSRHP